MGRYPTIVVTKENEDKESVIYSFGPHIESCKNYPDRYSRWNFKVLKNETNPDEAFVLLDDIPEKHISLLYKCVHKVYTHVLENGGIENMNNIDFPENFEFIV
ncbi:MULTISPECIES: hypothetical protein [Bacillus]|uniref:Uncharacterized protein n=1 Tax=Bacillus pseudomycoides TaxID=64104 RepID=A0A1Y3M6G7_9BACI|nr:MULTISPECIES: hypothetical protein [Bacillus cereus group]EOP55178.1 hypothetical protein IIW_01312 [Bacillus cereus VD136]EOP73264.1 hypothetical protein KOW_00674 [Bacillus cereus VDM006]EOQ08757.1 hypothetical protein KOY_05247 [Bacillus cereus VDM021]MDF2084450.1 hypothetical protein [Bacillus pseudomycoides]OUM46015.1 hypothetical protein BW425_26165 [Bacillus pseudomycoides]